MIVPAVAGSLIDDSPARLTPEFAVRYRDFLAHYTERFGGAVIAASPPGLMDPTERFRLLPTAFETIREAEIVLWEPSIWQTALHGCEAFIGTRPEKDALPARPVLWLWNFVMLADIALGASEVTARCRLEAMVIAPIHTRRGIGVYAGLVVEPVEEPWRARNRGMPLFLDVLSPTDAGPVNQDAQAMVLAPLAFLRTTVAATERVVIPRPRRRALERNGHAVPEIRRVVLRRTERSLTAPPPMEAREWQCQWLVRGHWRKQWYPRAGEHKPVFVQPFVKGPADKPLRTPGATVYHAAR